MRYWNKILKEWSYRVGAIKPKDEKHLYQLEKILTEQGWSYEAIEEIKNNLLLEVGDTSATTFYHEFITGAVVGGWNPGTINTGADLVPALKFCQASKDGYKPMSGGGDIKNYTNKSGVSWFSSTQIPNKKIVADAKNVGTRIVKELGKAAKPVRWTGPTNDKSDFGAADIAGTFGKGYGDVGVSLKYGAGQLKNLTLGTFTQALGLKKMTGQVFLQEYKSNFDALTKDWSDLVTKLFKEKTNDKNARDIFKKHIKSTWTGYQTQKISVEDVNTLTAAVGMGELTSKDKSNFRYFCRKLQYKFKPKWKEWQVKRSKHFNDIFGNYFEDKDTDIRMGLHELFKKQLSVGKVSLFYGAKAGNVFWFIPSEELYNKNMGPEDFISDYEIKESDAGYKFILDIGTQEIPAIGSITIEIRFKKGQMEGIADAASTYQLVAKDWSGIMGAFRR